MEEALSQVSSTGLRLAEESKVLEGAGKRIFLNAGSGVKPLPGAPPKPTPAAIRAGLAPKETYAAGEGASSTVASAHGAAGVNLQGEPKRLRRLYLETIDGQPQEAAEADVLKLQALALDTLQTLFTNEFGDDLDLKGRLGEKQAFYSKHLPDKVTREEILEGKDALARRQDALNFVLRTFTGKDEKDSGLRRAVLQKMAWVGRRSDIAAILPHLRKGDSSDLYHGLEAVRRITGKKGSPVLRGALHKDSVIAPLLKKSALSETEKAQLIEAVLERGAIEKMHRLEGAGNRTPVYFVTFKETLPGKAGKRVPIGGVFKPETTWEGKDRAYFAREIAAYHFDRQFAKTGLVPPTVEAIVPIGTGGECGVGSMQYRVPDSKPLGGHAPGSSHDSPANWYDPQFDQLRSTEHFKRRMAQARTLAYVFNDPDKLKNDVFGNDNLGNVLVAKLDDGSLDLRLIDNALIFGNSVAPGKDVGKSLLPKEGDAQLLENLQQASPDRARDLVGLFVRDEDASDAAARLIRARDELAKRPKKG